jgi:hypothetical protein
MPIDTFPTKTRGDWRFAAFVAASGILIGLIYHANLWTFADNGFSILSDRLPYWDFTNLWAGSKMALQGHVGFLFDVEAYRATLREMFSPALPDQEWSYPPSMALIGAPLAMLPIMPAYFVWTFGTVALLHLAIRPLGLPLWVHLATLASPAVFMNAIFGQNGALTAALLIGGLLMAPKRPLLAGVLFGLLTIKPHLGILVPFCLIASRNWRAFASAAATGAALAIATGLVFGFEVWRLFLTETGPLMTSILEAPYPQPYHANALTVFIMARAAGAGVGAAYAAQFVATIAAAALVVWLWRPSAAMDHRRRALLTAMLAIVATPYGYTYDTIPMCVAIAYMFVATPRPLTGLLALAWLFPYVAHLLNFQGIGIGVLVPLALGVWMVAPSLPGRHRTGGRPFPDAELASGATSDRMKTVTTSS